MHNLQRKYMLKIRLRQTVIRSKKKDIKGMVFLFKHCLMQILDEKHIDNQQCLKRLPCDLKKYK